MLWGFNIVMQRIIKHNGRYLYPMYLSLLIFTVMGIQTILEFVGRWIKSEKNKWILEIVVYFILSFVIIYIMFGIACPLLLSTAKG